MGIRRLKIFFGRGGVRAARARIGVVRGMGVVRAAGAVRVMGGTRSGGSCGSGGSGENKKSEPFWGLTLYSNNEKRLNFF